MTHLLRLLLAVVLLNSIVFGQTTGAILGTVTDQTGAAMAGAKVTVKSNDTGFTHNVTSDAEGNFRVPQLAAGNYEVTVERSGFSTMVFKNLVLQLNQNANLPVKMEVASTTNTISVSTEAPLINTTNAEVGANFDSRRITELPLAPNRNVLNVALSVAGVSQLSSGNSSFASGGVSFSVNGMRTRSNNFIVDGSDSNNPSVGGLQQEINNPDIIAEFRLITNQFLAEYGRTAGSVVNIVTKSGTNEYHGSLFWFHNDNKLNSRSNLEKRTFAQAPWRIENQFGGTFGGAIVKNKTFGFGSIMRWTDRQFAAGSSIQGAPTEAGKAVLRPLAASRPQLQAVLDYLPAAQVSTGQNLTANVNGQAITVPVGILSGAQPALLNLWQDSIRIDHRFNDKHSIGGRYLYDGREQVSGQSVPPGLTSQNPARRQNGNVFVNSSFSPKLFNEFRVGFQRVTSATLAADESSLKIPSLEVTSMGLAGFNAANSRTAIGLAINLPQSSAVTNYQLMDNFSVLRGSHTMKMGFDFRRQNQNQDFNPSLRGRIQYGTLQDLVDDLPLSAVINSFLPGVGKWQAYQYYDYFFFWQDEWRIKPNFTLTYGLRYETPGNAFDFLTNVNNRVVAANNNDERYRMDKAPARDMNNWAPRFGFNYRFGKAPGFLGWLTGDQKLVMRGGYSRTYDFIFNNVALNIYSAFPFTIVNTFPARTTGNFARIQDVAAGRIVPGVSNPTTQTRTIVDSGFRSPIGEQFSFNLQREVSRDWAFTIGWVGTKGTGLFQTLDGNPTVPVNNVNGTVRVNPNRGIIRHRANAASSIYHSLQTSLEKRLSRNFSMGAHYTWSAFIDDASEVFNPSVAGEVAVPQDSFNRRGDRGRSTYDRPQRFSTNFTYELPFMRAQKGVAGRVLGGWTVSGFLTFQSGPPYSPLAGVDPGFRLSGIDGLVGNSIRPNLNTSLNLSGMSTEEVFRSGTFTGGIFNLFSPVSAANPIGNVGRNTLRADGINNLDLAVKKNFRIVERHSFDLRVDFYNLTNSRDFGIPNSSVNSPGFGNQWNTDGGKRRIQFGLRYWF